MQHDRTARGDLMKPERRAGRIAAWEGRDEAEAVDGSAIRCAQLESRRCSDEAQNRGQDGASESGESAEHGADS